MDKKSVGNWFESKRESMGKTKVEFSAFLMITPQIYQHIINGRAYPSFDVVAKMASVFDVRELFGGK